MEFVDSANDGAEGAVFWAEGLLDVLLVLLKDSRAYLSMSTDAGDVYAAGRNSSAYLSAQNLKACVAGRIADNNTASGLHALRKL
eukprot:1159619-Pelagomonas_calceolata.AAC.13